MKNKVTEVQKDNMLAALTGSPPHKRGQHSQRLHSSSGTRGGPTSAALAFPLMSASSSLSSSLSFLMQSKYSFCLSRAWPHMRKDKRQRQRQEKKQRNSWRDCGQTCDTSWTQTCTTHEGNNGQRRGHGCMLTHGVKEVWDNTGVCQELAPFVSTMLNHQESS